MHTVTRGNIPQPRVLQTGIRGCLHETATIVPTDDDVLHLAGIVPNQRTMILNFGLECPNHLEDTDGVLRHTQACEAVVEEHVAYVPEHDSLVWQEVEGCDLVKAAVRAADP